MQGLSGLFDAPNRQQLAEQSFNQILEDTADQRKLGTQRIGQNAARLGRLGSGVVTTSLGDLESQLNKNQMQALRGLSTDAAAQEMQDRLGRLGAASGLSGQLGGQDLASAGFNQGIRQEGRGERSAAEQSALNDLAARQSQAGFLGGRESQQFGQEASQRGEQRGERGYQYGLSQDATQDQVRQAQMEQDQLQNLFQNTFAQQGLSGQLGAQASAGTNAGQLALANMLQNRATGTQQGVGDLMQAYMAQQGGGAQQAPQQAPQQGGGADVGSILQSLVSGAGPQIQPQIQQTQQQPLGNFDFGGIQNVAGPGGTAAAPGGTAGSDVAAVELANLLMRQGGLF